MQDTSVSHIVSERLGEDDAHKIVALCYCQGCRGKALSNAGNWLEQREHLRQTKPLRRVGVQQGSGNPRANQPGTADIMPKRFADVVAGAAREHVRQGDTGPGVIDAQEDGSSTVYLRG